VEHEGNARALANTELWGGRLASSPDGHYGRSRCQGCVENVRVTSPQINMLHMTQPGFVLYTLHGKSIIYLLDCPSELNLH